MRKPDQIRAIFAELRATLGPEVPAADLLKIAVIILRSYYSEEDELAGFGRPGQARSFISMPVDEALVDGGWRVLEFERDAETACFDRDEPDSELHSLVARFLGPGWEYGTE